jgi:hypothetical protein
LIKNKGMDISSRLHFIREYTVKEWLCCASICISNWSTVILDASAIDLPTYVFQPDPLPACLNAEWIEIFDKIVDYTDFENVLKEKCKSTVSGTYIDKYIDTEKNPIEDIANFLQISVKDNVSWKSSVYSIQAFLCEWTHLIRSKIRTIAYKITIFRKYINKKIMYDYFEEEIW